MLSFFILIKFNNNFYIKVLIKFKDFFIILITLNLTN